MSADDCNRLRNQTRHALLRCPFCGGEPEEYKERRYTHIQCGQCGGQSNGFTIASLARDAWNTRSTN